MQTITLQQIVDKNYEWFVVEKHPQSTKEGSVACVYRGKDGAKCAIGCVLPDSLYEPSMDKWGAGVVNILNNRPNVRAFFGDIPAETLRQLQVMHDHYLFGDDGFDQHMDRELRLFAFQYNLNYPPKA